MLIEPLGDSAYLIRCSDSQASILANVIEELSDPTILETVVSYESVAVYVDPLTFDPESLANLDTESAPIHKSRLLEIPVCYDRGEDLEITCELLHLSVDQLISAHLAETYLCYALGFQPGFPYLGYLHPTISGVPRLDSPRIQTTPGSVGITGRQTGIYPSASPGGWRLIGQTPVTIVDLDDDYFPIKAGDRIRFRQIGEKEFNSLLGERL